MTSLGIHDLWLFIVSGLLLNLTPGPDSILVMTRTGQHGWRAGSAASLGIGAGVGVHVAAAALGLSALLATSATAFTVVKLVGAAYLAWMGIGMLRAAWRAPSVAASAGAGVAGAAGPASGGAPSLPRLFWQGFATNALNPKVALFFLAFVPQFITPDAPSKALAFVVLGLVFDLNGMLYLHALVALTALARRRVSPDARVGRAIHGVLGALFVALGLRLALASR